MYGTKGSNAVHFDLLISEALVNFNHINGYAYSYFVEPNDTLTISFKNGLPLAKSSNKKLSDYDLNSSALFHSKHLQNTKFNTFTIPLSFTIPKDKQFTVEEYISVLDSIDCYLDSLSQKGLIFPHILELRKQELQVEALSSKAYAPKFDYSSVVFEDNILPLYNYNSLVNMYIGYVY